LKPNRSCCSNYLSTAFRSRFILFSRATSACVMDMDGTHVTPMVVTLARSCTWDSRRPVNFTAHSGVICVRLICNACTLHFTRRLRHLKNKDWRVQYGRKAQLPFRPSPPSSYAVLVERLLPESFRNTDSLSVSVCDKAGRSCRVVRLAQVLYQLLGVVTFLLLIYGTHPTVIHLDTLPFAYRK
jgi:hypothetical protein